MAYKFQLGTTTLSGSTTFEEDLTSDGTLTGGSVVSNGTVSGSGALQGASVAVDGAITAGSLSGSGALQAGGAVTLDGVAEETGFLTGSDSLYFRDDSASGQMRSVPASNFVGAIAGRGLAEANAQLEVDLAANSGLSVDAGGSGTQMVLNINGLATASVDVAADDIAFVDTSDPNNATRKLSIVDFVAGIAGSGLQASSGSLSTDGAAVTTAASGSTLATGVNYFANISALAGVTMPASGDSSVGDRVIVKAADGVSATNYIEIKTAASAQKIDGRDEIRLESPYAAVTLVYVVADEWRLI
jgi:hypothetical protein